MHSFKAGMLVRRGGKHPLLSRDVGDVGEIIEVLGAVLVLKSGVRVWASEVEEVPATPPVQEVSTPPLKRIVVLHGHDLSGKSTLARSIQTLIPDSAIVPLADAVRDEVVRVNRCTRDEVYAKPTTSAVRDSLRTMGDTMRNWHGQDYWLKQWQSKVHEFDAQTLIVDDGRTPVEMLGLLEQGAKVVVLITPRSEPEYSEDLPEIVKKVWTARAIMQQSEQYQKQIFVLADSDNAVWRTHSMSMLAKFLLEEVA